MRGVISILSVVSVLTAAYASSVVRAADQPAADKPAIETKEQYEARIQWWREARFGMFIHWGSVSLKGTEIGE